MRRNLSIRARLWLYALAAVTACVGMRTTVAALPEPGMYRSADGRTLHVSLFKGEWRDPLGKVRKLDDCGDEFQVCFSDGHNFGFSLPRKCAGWMPRANQERLKIHPQFVGIIHEYSWIIFPDYPEYIFQYADSRGVVGIYTRAEAPINFGIYFKKGRAVSDFEDYAFRSVNKIGIAACE
ncbi:hypothetical protein [Azospirillum sp. B4]|uniref:hypothetical protein n=1 Tax=Azospirillum sp. B4 TaxID=95605 RepID=UPI0011DDBB49|nr:hypothetical protein [Azospirillum sp. B4]